MKISVSNEQKIVSFKPDNEMDFFWLGAISSKNENVVLWEGDSIKKMEMYIEDVVKGLGRANE